MFQVRERQQQRLRHEDGWEKSRVDHRDEQLCGKERRRIRRAFLHGALTVLKAEEKELRIGCDAPAFRNRHQKLPKTGVVAGLSIILPFQYNTLIDVNHKEWCSWRYLFYVKLDTRDKVLKMTWQSDISMMPLYFLSCSVATSGTGLRLFCTLLWTIRVRNSVWRETDSTLGFSYWVDDR